MPDEILPPIITRADAKARGLKRYFTGKPCKHGHVAERYLCGLCCKCDRLWQKTYYHQDPVKYRAMSRAWQMAHPEYMREYIKDWDQLNPGRRRDHRNKWKLANPEKDIEAKRKSAALPKSKARRAQYVVDRLKTDPLFRLSRGLRTRLGAALHDDKKGGSAIRDLGCTIAELKIWLESQFAPEMTWENRGPVWHVDHKIPLAAFDLTDPVELKQACHYTNLQPLFARDNHRKGSTNARR
jgi:hypothetical protein